MKIEFECEAIKNDEIEISKSRKDLYDLYRQVIIRLRAWDFGTLSLFIKEELAKSKSSTQIKVIPTENAYEFRIPPHRKGGVLRMLFVVEDDCFTVCIKRIWVKINEPQKRRRGNARK